MAQEKRTERLVTSAKSLQSVSQRCQRQNSTSQDHISLSLAQPPAQCRGVGGKVVVQHKKWPWITADWQDYAHIWGVVCLRLKSPQMPNNPSFYRSARAQFFAWLSRRAWKKPKEPQIAVNPWENWADVGRRRGTPSTSIFTRKNTHCWNKTLSHE